MGALLTLMAASAACGGTGPYDESTDPGEAPWGSCLDGKCDTEGAAGLIICGPRDVARARPGCSEASATDIGIDPVTAEVAVPLHVVLENMSHEGVQVALVLRDDAGEEVRRIDLWDRSDGAHRVIWDGHDDDGADVTAPLHSAVIEARHGDEVIEGHEHWIGTLVSLADEGVGYNHPLGTDAPDTDDWGRVHVIDALTAVGAAWPYETPIAYLDLSARNGGEFKPHWTHRHGESVDFRYLRNDGEGKLDLRWQKSHYDQQASQALVDMLFDQGAVEIYCDRRSGLTGDSIVHVAGHANHMHARFGLIEGDTGQDRPINDGRSGGPCEDDSDCNVRKGFCLRPEGATTGTCTVSCEKYCDDYVGGIYTLTECVDTQDGRLCMPARDHERYPATEGCREGLEAQSLASYDHQGALTEVCVP